MKEKTVYIAGAGLSAIAGVPVMSNFISKAKDMFADFPDKYHNFTSVFSRLDDLAKIKNYFNADLFNIEEVLSIYDMESTLWENRKRKKANFIEFIKDVVIYHSYDSCDISTPGCANWIDCLFPCKTQGKSAKELGFFVAAIFNLKIIRQQGTPGSKALHAFPAANSRRAYSIISLNYDCLLESVTDYINRDLRNDGDEPLRFEKSKYDSSWDTPMLFKIHGDLDSGRIIPPTWAKAIDPSQRSIWSNAFSLLADCTEIRFLGYSLPLSDTYFQYFLKAAIKSNKHLKKIDVICLDPSSDVQKRYEQVFNFRDFYYRNGDLKDYCQGIWQHRLTGCGNEYTVNTLEDVHEQFMRRMRV